MTTQKDETMNEDRYFQDHVERVETVASVRSRQTLWLPWMQEACAGLTDDSFVSTLTRSTPFGTYLLEIRATPI